MVFSYQSVLVNQAQVGTRRCNFGPYLDAIVSTHFTTELQLLWIFFLIKFANRWGNISKKSISDSKIKCLKIFSRMMNTTGICDEVGT